MSTWNVRILRRVYPGGEVELFPAEVHYSDDRAETPTAYGTFSASSDSLDGVRFFAAALARACDQDILDETSFHETKIDE